MNWAEVAALAERQHGLVTTAQVGCRPDRTVSRGRLVPVRRGVYAVAGVPPSPWRALAAALLTVDGVASHRAAAALHGFVGVLPGSVEVTVFAATAPRLHGVVAHQASVLHADEVVIVHGLPATSPSRTLVDLAGRPDVGPRLLERMLDDCIVRRMCTAEDVSASLGRLARKAGARRLRPLLDARTATDSHLERLWLRRLCRAGLTPPAVGYQLVLDGRVLVLDFAWPQHRVGLEVDGWAPHATRSRFDSDRLRDLAAVRVGWTVLRVTSRTPPSQLFATLRSLISQ